jgi:hypothetical protein
VLAEHSAGGNGAVANLIFLFRVFSRHEKGHLYEVA